MAAALEVGDARERTFIRLGLHAKSVAGTGDMAITRDSCVSIRGRDDGTQALARND